MKRLSALTAMIGMLLCPLPGPAQDAPDTTIKPEETETTSPIKHLAEIRFDEFVVQARMINIPLPGRTRTVQDILERMERYGKDDAIGGVLLDIGNLALPLPDIQELRQAIDRLKDQDKKVYAFLNATGPMGYLLACGAHEIATPPSGSVMLPGLGGLYPFMKGHFQMLGLEYDVITAGRFKYPGFLNSREPSKYFLEEFNAILDSMYDDYRSIIADSRGLSREQVTEIIDNALFRASEAQHRGLVDELAYYDDYHQRLLSSNKFKKYRGDALDLSQVNSIQDLMEMINRELKKATEARQAIGPKIAVLHARGPIIDYNLGIGLSSVAICRDDFIKVVDELRKNKSIKAVVMRVDSPGGSGYASDMIWKQLQRLDEVKPLVVSMGNVAGSGGYYIACPARRIFAQPTTITGSIGVLGVFQSAWSMYNRMDYEIAEMRRGARSLLGAPHRTMDAKDREFIQGFIDDFYDIFINRVAQTRRLPEKQVRQIAEGRIYTGRQAIDLGLVDELGGLEDAINAARGMAGIPPSAELKVLHYPRPSSLGELFQTLGAVSVESQVQQLMSILGPARTMSFDQQLATFSRTPQPLCWMAIPDEWLTVPSPMSPWSLISPATLRSDAEWMPDLSH